MANLVDNAGDATSNLVAGNGTNSARFTMPGNVALQVESVVATVNNAAGAATRATLVVRDQSGVVIATKRQRLSIPAGDTGTATWALRDDDSGAGGGIDFDTANVGGFLSIETTAAGGVAVEADAGDVSFTVDAGDFNVYALAGQVYLDGSAMSIFSENFDMVIDSHQDIQIFARGGGANIWDITGSLAIQTGAGFDIALTAGQFLTVRDHLGNAIFRVDEDGDLHGLTGKALVFDL